MTFQSFILYVSTFSCPRGFSAPHRNNLLWAGEGIRTPVSLSDPDYKSGAVDRCATPAKNFPTSVIEQLTQRQIDFIFDVELLLQVFNPSPLLFTSECRFSLLFPFTVSITLLYVSHWPQSRVCHYKVFQLSIQYARWVLRIPHHLIQTRPRKVILKINLINPLRLLIN